jgi:ribosomal protein S4
MGRKPLTPEQRERRRASKKRWHEEHREERLAASPERRAYVKAWQEAQREELRSYKKQQREKIGNAFSPKGGAGTRKTVNASRKSGDNDTESRRN